ncbi:MAG: outer membrane protein assembly factor BamE [Candidatus Nitrotoga sp.]
MYIKLIFVALLLSACGNTSTPRLPSFTPHKMDIRQGNLITPAMREKLKPGMSRTQVRSILGTPLINDAMHQSRWDYVYRLEKNYKLVDQQHLILLFDNDRLKQIDDSGMPPLASVPDVPSTQQNESIRNE